jgi:hypothetical protein
MTDRVLVRMPKDLLDRIITFADAHPLIEGNLARAMRALAEAGLREVGRGEKRAR